MKRIIGSSVMLIAVLVFVVSGTAAFFTDSESSTGNVFTAGSVDLLINHTAATYNGQNCVQDCDIAPGVVNLLVNGGFEEPVLSSASQFYDDDTQVPGWDLVAGAGIQLRRDIPSALDSDQHFEFDSSSPDPTLSGTTIAQTFTTVPGQRYQLSFYHSPRPFESADNNTFEFTMNVVDVSDNSTNLSASISSGAGGSSVTDVNWQQETYEFIASGNVTTLQFAYTGTQNRAGGLLDEITVVAMECIDAEFTGIDHAFCELWESKDLTTESFFNFTDLKPADNGSNLISLTVEGNSSYMCFQFVETNASLGTGDGSLDEYVDILLWESDEFGNQINLIAGPGSLSELGAVAYAEGGDTPLLPGDTNYMLLEWCFGEFVLDGSDYVCNGAVSNINDTQGAELEAALQFLAIQSRNNADFSCEAAPFADMTP